MLAHCHTKQFEQYHYQCVVFDVFVVYHFLLTVAMLKRVIACSPLHAFARDNLGKRVPRAA